MKKVKNTQNQFYVEEMQFSQGKVDGQRVESKTSGFTDEIKKLKSYFCLRIILIFVIIVFIILYLLFSNFRLNSNSMDKKSISVKDEQRGDKKPEQKQIEKDTSDRVNELILKQIQKNVKIEVNKQIHNEVSKEVEKQMTVLRQKMLNKSSEEIKKPIDSQHKVAAQNKTELQLAMSRREENIKIQNPNQHSPLGPHQDHPQMTYPYDTMGMKKNEKFNNQIVTQTDYYRFQESFFDMLKPYNDTSCELERLGDQGDGGYPVCINYLNHSKGLLNLGIEGRDNLGCSLTTRESMPNYQFDCTNVQRPSCGTNKNSNVFTLGCLNERTQQSDKQFFSLKEMVDRSNMTGKNIILKIDIEGAEWEGFKTFPIEYLKLVDQLLLEIHLPGPNLSWIKLRWGNLPIMKAIQQHFYSVYLHMNFYACRQKDLLTSKQRKIPSSAIQISLVNKRVAHLKSNSRSYIVNCKNENYARVCDLND